MGKGNEALQLAQRRGSNPGREDGPSHDHAPPSARHQLRGGTHTTHVFLDLADRLANR